MNITSDLRNPILSRSKPTIVMSAALGFILVAILLPLPRAGMPVNHPYKIELLLSLFLIFFFAFKVRKRKQREIFAARDSSVRLVFFGFILFALWSGLSALWAKSLGSVAHHTLLWSMFSFFLLIFTGFVRPGARFVTDTFTIVSLIIAFSCFLDYLTISDFSISEIGFRVRYAKSAELLVTLSPLLWAAAIYSRRRRWVVMLAAAVGWVTVMLSLSKGAFLAGIVGFSIFFIGSGIWSHRGFRRRIITSAAVWLLLTIGTQVLFSSFSIFPSTSQYLTGSVDPARTSSNVRVFTWNVAGQMVADNWLIGVGGDNFGMSLNDGRAQFWTKSPVEPKDEIAEDYLLERAHNEPLQVLTELGVIGLVLFLLPFAIFAVYFLRCFRRDRSRFSSVLWASVAGMVAFLTSSQFSSFSFRSAQNGVVFIAVFAIAINEIAKLSRTSRNRSEKTLFSHSAYLLGWLTALSMIVFCVSKGIAEYQLYRAERTEMYSEAQDHYRAAVAADPEYAGAFYLHGARASAEGTHAEAALLTQKAIDYGLGAALAFSQLARQQIAAHDGVGAEATFREGLAIYPRSIFFRTEFAVFLENQGRPDEAAEHLAVARSINFRHANGWHAMIKDGSTAAFYSAQDDPNVAPPAELAPHGAVIRYLDTTPGINANR